MHLASHSRTPAILSVNGAVVCGTCDDRSFERGCGCETYRKREHDRWQLPALRWIEEINLSQLQLFAPEGDPFAALWRAIVTPPLTTNHG